LKKQLRIFTIIFLFTFNLYSSVYSSQIPGTSAVNFSYKNNFRLSDKKDKPALSDKQINGFLDENDNPLFVKNKKNSDTLGTDAFQERILNGMNAGDQFGSSVSGAGDVNGDGYEDIIVGAPTNSAGGSSAGRAYIFYGGAIFNSTPDVIITGSGINNYLGVSVSSAGDVNGDGYDDVIVGISGYSAATGRAQIYYGGASMNNTPDVILTGEVAGDNFGFSVSDAGDVNGDGFSDVIAGAYANTTSTGKAYIYFGSSSMNNTADVTLSEPGINKSFGYSVSKAGDFNGDGYSDVIVGVPGYSTNLGRAYIYSGGSTMNTIADGILAGFVAGTNYYGNSVSDAGDVNGDGYGDVVVGAYGMSSFQGRVFVYYGGAIINITADQTMTGEFTGDNFGTSVSSAGDANGDGYDDILIGASGFSSGSGKTYLYLGGETIDDNADKFFNAENAGDNFGISVSGCGDINGDGNSDLIVGAYSNDINGANSGRAYIYFNTMTGTDIEDLTFTGAGTNDVLGCSVSSAGDVNGDGYDDIIIGAFGYNGGTNQGRAYIYFGGSSMNNTADVTLTGVSVGDYFGDEASSAGDVNGDGFSDVIVGAPGYLTDQGRAYIYYGGSTMNSTVDVTLTGFSSNDGFGISVSEAGDVNGDGYADVIAGAYGYNAGTNQGRAYIYFGGSSMDNTADVTLLGGLAGDRFGLSVSNTGDVNGDGFGDVIVGAESYSGGTDQGRAYIYFGGDPMNNNSDVVLTGVSAGDQFGNSVSLAGDMNGDGLSDVIVGAKGYNSFQGRAYVFFGGISMNSVVDVTLTGVSSGDQFGSSVSSVRDMNGDGFDDVIVGAALVNRAYIYFGGRSVNNTADLNYSGDLSGENFGNSVSEAGDVNGDGLGDLIVGAKNSDAGGLNAGKAYLYFSSSPVVNPRIVSVKDVPFDQGGKVKLKWIRSGYDYLNQNLITGYLIEKSDPPGDGGFYWEALATVPATMNPSYQYTATTPNDSLGGNSGVQYYRITAQTSDNDQFWRSNIMSGYSVDNLSPAAPVSLAAFPDLNSVFLNWNGNSETDFHHYIIYRNGVQLYTSLVNSFDDPAVTDDSVYNYQVAAVDIHGNISPLSNIANVFYNNAGNLNLTVVMEGFYNSALNNMAISDTASVYLRSSVFPYAIIDSSKGIINGITLTGSFRISNAPTENYYIVVKHRNTIETWSSTTVSYTSLSTIAYNFTNLITKAFGNNMISVDASPVRFAIYSGDINQDGTIDASDVSNADNDAFSSVSGYVNSDVTGDNFVDAADVSIVDNNAFNSVSVITP